MYIYNTPGKNLLQPLTPNTVTKIVNIPTVSYVFMWSDDRNCDVSADFPTSGAPSIATRNTFITGDSSGLANSPPPWLLFLGTHELFLELSFEGLRDEDPEHDIYTIFLSNRVYPTDANGEEDVKNVKEVRKLL